MRAVTSPVNETVPRRDFIPSGEELTSSETLAVRGFDRQAFDIQPDFQPDPDAEAPSQPIGNPEDAGELAILKMKDISAKDQAREDSGEAHTIRVERIKHLNVGDTIAFIEQQNPSLREKWLKAEKETQNRVTVLRYFGYNG